MLGMADNRTCTGSRLTPQLLEVPSSPVFLLLNMVMQNMQNFHKTLLYETCYGFCLGLSQLKEFEVVKCSQLCAH